MFRYIDHEQIRHLKTITCDFFLFGATGDLSKRKIIPSLYQLFNCGKLSNESRLIALAHDEFEPALAEAKNHIENIQEDQWRSFCQLWTAVTLDLQEKEGFEAVAQRFYHPSRIQIAYLAIFPDLFVPVCTHLAAVGLNHANMRVVLEKPLGHDLASNICINRAIALLFTEEQIFRIDHYLGKESVQNLLAIRFGNSLFEPLWRREYISNITISVAETMGIGKRAKYYEQAGALKDMVQNHLMQLLCFVAMEVPTGVNSEYLRQEKLKVIRALRPMQIKQIQDCVVRGQYGSGSVDHQFVPAYIDEEQVQPDSRTETFIAMKVMVDNWRWQGVPFFLRTGKRLAKQMAEIVINFKDVPHALIKVPVLGSPNQLIIQIQPTENIELKLMCKQAGEILALEPVTLSLNPRYDQHFKPASAYERLLWDVICGRLGLFMHSQEQEAAWQFVSPIQAALTQDLLPLFFYPAGSWGPKSANDLLTKEGAFWQEMWNAEK